MCLRHVLHSESVSSLVYPFGVTTGSSVLFYYLFVSCGVAGGRALAVEMDDVSLLVSVLRADSETASFVSWFLR